jgi:hypothetical protein
MQWILATALEHPFLDQPHIFMRLFHQFMLKFVGSHGISEIRMSESSFYQRDTDKIQRTKYGIHRIEVHSAAMSAALSSHEHTSTGETRSSI